MAELRITHTGIRNNERITSSASGTQNRGTVIIVRSLSGEEVAYPPSSYWVNQIDDITLRDTFNTFDFFHNMTPAARKEWLLAHSIPDKDLYLEDRPVKIKFVKIGGKFFTTTLTPEQIDTLLRGNPNDSEGFWPISEVYNMIPRKPGSKARKHTLIFRPSNWSLMASETVSDSFNGLYWNLDTLELKQGLINKPRDGYLRIITVEQSTTLLREFAIVTNTKRDTALTWNTLLNLCGDFTPDMIRIKPIIEWFPPALHKSLIQKLIRTKCLQVSHNGELYDAGSVLLASLSLLMLHPGSFVPNIQRFVTGMESIKRLAVSINEDSFVEDNRLITSIYAGAILAQHDRTWQPIDNLVSWWFRTAIMAQRETKIYQYNWHEPLVPFREWNSLTFNYLLLNELHSFESDILMLGSIANYEGRARVYSGEQQTESFVRWNIMLLTHCIDHHTYTDIAHYMPYDERGYKEVFQSIWNNLVGVNPRLSKYKDWNPETKIVKTIREAQRLLWLAKTTKTKLLRPILEIPLVPFSYKLDNEWLAGLIGNIEVKIGTINAVAVLSTTNILELTAIKKPSRDIKGNPELTEEEHRLAVEQARLLLHNGYRLTHVPSTLPELHQATVYLVGEDYWLQLSDGTRKLWTEFTHLNYNFPTHPQDVLGSEDAILKTGNGIMAGADAGWRQLLNQLSPKALRRLLMYLEGNQSEIKLFKIGRDGTGVDYTVLPEDSTVHLTLCYLCGLYPVCLEKDDTTFKVKNGPLLWSLRYSLHHKVGREASLGRWPVVERPPRHLWEHQIDSIRRMKERQLAGKKGFEINIGTGLGKTAIVLEYILWLIASNKMPEYCVYTLPPSAVDSIVREITFYTLPYQVIDMRKEGIFKTLVPNKINLVLHDQLRMMPEQLKDKASNMLFIVDEFHKTINKTLRTSVALEVVRLSQNFVAMSGTIIKSNALEELYEWLQQVVEFEVNDHNYFVAIGSLISKKVTTHIVVERPDVDASRHLSPRYYELVPKSLGGTSETLHFREALIECYKAILVELVNQTLLYLNSGEKVFMVVQNYSRQAEVKTALERQGVRNIWLITKNTPITLTMQDNSPIQVVITTKQHVEGYTLVDRRIAIYELFLGNQATYEQADGRMNRLNQPSSVIRIITVHAGILSYIMKRYEKARTLAEVIKGFADELHIDPRELRE